MFKKLQGKWGVNGWNLLLIISTFAIGGSLCGFLGRKILIFTGLEKNLAWFVIYIVLMTLIWPLCVLLVSIPLGQFVFFKRYIGKILNRFKKNGIAENHDGTTSLAIFASGAGSNAEKIIAYFKNNPRIKVALVVSNKANAGVIQIAAHNGIEYLLADKALPLTSDTFIAALKARNIDLIVLAGFLLKVPPAIVKAFPGKIINIHPALLPSYGGKGMYGMNVHEAVIANKDVQSGISIHYVDELYDHGEIIQQVFCTISPGDNAKTLSEKIHLLEHQHYAPAIENLVKKQKTS